MTVRLESIKVVKEGKTFTNFYVVNGDHHVLVKTLPNDKQGYYRLKDWAEPMGVKEK